MKYIWSLLPETGGYQDMSEEQPSLCPDNQSCLFKHGSNLILIVHLAVIATKKFQKERDGCDISEIELTPGP